jgi:hypothetical protein
MPKLDQNLVFGEGHDKPDLITFLSTHMGDFYARDYRVLVCELSGALPVGDLLDSSLQSNAPLQAALDRAHQLVVSGGNAQNLLNDIQNDLPSVAAVGSHKDEFGLLVRHALEAHLKVIMVDYLTGKEVGESPSERVRNYNNYASPILRGLREKWLLLTGDDHVKSEPKYKSTGIIEQIGQNVVGFRYQTLTNALSTGTLQHITDLENVASA